MAEREKPEFLTVDDVALEFGISKDAIRKAIHENSMPCRKVGNQWRFSREGLHHWLSTGNIETERERRAVLRGDMEQEKGED